ncbi:hypothetical protein BDN72DRAFT_773295 [Pluteus cervinus]|uniref:Uncharacterized protein n=1 Tax=Pluteus cervinus TaxID=181527 RepID=A0ACD3AIA2_9AGAR|nr:hypothetical protein BDN72DRAFT_773295 [Pluteus cervinus]
MSAHTQEPTSFSVTETLNDVPVSYSSPSPSPTSPRLNRTNSRFTGHPVVITSAPQDVPSDAKPRPSKEETIDPHQNLAFIPPTCERRTLVMCFDGTGDQFDNDNSNVVQLVSLLKKSDRHKQRVYYQSGVGTYESPTANNPLTRKASKVCGIIDVMLAWDLDAHVMDGYSFLMENYTEGDKICIFGFSRGAYTARSLAGMIHKVGLLPAGNVQQVAFAYKMYKRTDPLGWEQSNAFKRAFSIDVDIEFLGVWDTVDSVGLITKRLPFTTSNTIVKTFRHAVSLDERRAKFKANLWNRPDQREQKLGLSNENSTPPSESDSQGRTSSSPSSQPSTPTFLKPSFSQRSDRTLINSKSLSSKHTKNHSNTSSAWETEEDKELAALETVFAQKEKKETDVEEVWFAGCHCDVGGGSVDNKTRYALARIPLRWMIRECFKANTGIMFDVEGLRRLGLWMDPNMLYPFVTPRPPAIMPLENPKEPKDFLCRPYEEEKVYSEKVADLVDKKLRDSSLRALGGRIGSEEEEELRDALSPVYDQLKLAKPWWILEYVPLNLRYQEFDCTWVSRNEMNRARPRMIPEPNLTKEIKVHRSVKIREAAQYPPGSTKAGKKYGFRAQLPSSVKITYVD